MLGVMTPRIQTCMHGYNRSSFTAKIAVIGLQLFMPAKLVC